MMEQRFQELLREKGIELSSPQLQQFHTYYEQLIEWNEKINLTAITDREAVYFKHFYDSLTPSFFYDFSRPLSLCDVGAGAGFPSLPLKICFPDLKVTIVDSLNKRIHFLTSLIDALGLKNVEVHHARAELFAKKSEFRESFDVVTARAVAKLPVLCEYCLPLARTGGDFLAMKGASIQPELEESERAIELLGGQLESVESLLIPGEMSKRHIVRISKQAGTPASYPRKPGTPNKRPL
ncbi:MAG TPA: 16S rRNA (guanine(527)-N(7))-methyltransferase RsmG [Bacillales bacterium]|nr:16S rRNA (guanine(527)-N(7))-methyltransferase RsmG [Bacillales bacterium]